MRIDAPPPPRSAERVDLPRKRERWENKTPNPLGTKTFADSTVTDRLRATATHQDKGRQRMSDAQNTGSNAASDTRPTHLRDALRRARIEAAERTAVVVNRRDGEGRRVR